MHNSIRKKNPNVNIKCRFRRPALGGTQVQKNIVLTATDSNNNVENIVKTYYTILLIL